MLTLDDAGATVVLTSGALTSLSLSGAPALHVPGLSVSAASASVSITSGTTRVSVTGATLLAGGLSLRADLGLTTSYDAAGVRTLTITLAQHTGTGSHDFLHIDGVLIVASATGTLTSTATGTTGRITLGSPQLDATTFGATAHATSVTLAFDGSSTSIEIVGAVLSINGYGFTGNLALDRRGTVTRLAFSDVTVTAGAASLTHGTGGFVLAPAGSTGGVAGVFNAELNGTFAGITASGKVFVRVNTSHVAVDEQLEVGGRTIAVQFADPGTATVFDIAITDATLDIGGFLSIQGSLSSQGCGTGCRTLAGQGLRIFVGRGPAFFSDGGLNPLATGVLISNATVGVVEMTGTTTTYAVSATGTVSLVGVDGVTLGGTVAVRWNDTGAAVHRTATFEGGSADPVQVDLAAGIHSVSVTAATIGVLGQTLTADIAIDRTTGGDTILGFARVSLDLGPASLRNGQGLLLLGPTGVAGRISGDLALDVPGVTFGAGISLALNTRPTAVNESLTVGTTTTRLDLAAGPYLRLDGTAVTLTVLGQSITADVSVERTATTTTVVLGRVGLQLMANGYGVALTNGAGTLVVGATGLAGRISGQVALVLPAGVSATGTLGLAVNTATTAALGLPGGPYLRFEATGLRLTVAGQVLTGDFAFEKVATSPTTSIIKVAATHVALDLAGVLRLREGTALILLPGTGLAASISGTVSLAVPGVTIAGTLATELNTTGGNVVPDLHRGGRPHDAVDRRRGGRPGRRHRPPAHRARPDADRRPHHHPQHRRRRTRDPHHRRTQPRPRPRQRYDDRDDHPARLGDAGRRADRGEGLDRRRRGRERPRRHGQRQRRPRRRQRDGLPQGLRHRARPERPRPADPRLVHLRADRHRPDGGRPHRCRRRHDQPRRPGRGQ